MSLEIDNLEIKGKIDARVASNPSSNQLFAAAFDPTREDISLFNSKIDVDITVSGQHAYGIFSTVYADEVCRTLQRSNNNKTSMSNNEISGSIRVKDCSIGNGYFDVVNSVISAEGYGAKNNAVFTDYTLEDSVDVLKNGTVSVNYFLYNASDNIVNNYYAGIVTKTKEFPNYSQGFF